MIIPHFRIQLANPALQVVQYARVLQAVNTSQITTQMLDVTSLTSPCGHFDTPIGKIDRCFFHCLGYEIL